MSLPVYLLQSFQDLSNNSTSLRAAGVAHGDMIFMLYSIERQVEPVYRKSVFDCEWLFGPLWNNNTLNLLYLVHTFPLSNQLVPLVNTLLSRTSWRSKHELSGRRRPRLNPYPLIGLRLIRFSYMFKVEMRVLEGMYADIVISRFPSLYLPLLQGICFHYVFPPRCLEFQHKAGWPPLWIRGRRRQGHGRFHIRATTRGERVELEPPQVIHGLHLYTWLPMQCMTCDQFHYFHFTAATIHSICGLFPSVRT